MQHSFEVSFSDAAVRRIVCAAFPDAASSRRNVKVDVRESVHVADYWSEGSRTYTAFVELATGASVGSGSIPKETRQVAANPFGHPIADVTLRDGFCAVEHMIFRGKSLGYRIVIHPANVAPLLPPHGVNALPASEDNGGAES